jgi:hypothetical protein
VRAAKARGKVKDLPSCAHWPHNVRPKGYYQGAVVEEEENDKTPPTPPEPEPPAAPTIVIPADPIGAALALAGHFQGEQLWEFDLAYHDATGVGWSLDDDDDDEDDELETPEAQNTRVIKALEILDALESFTTIRWGTRQYLIHRTNSARSLSVHVNFWDDALVPPDKPNAT